MTNDEQNLIGGVESVGLRDVPARMQVALEVLRLYIGGEGLRPAEMIVHESALAAVNAFMLEGVVIELPPMRPCYSE